MKTAYPGWGLAPARGEILLIASLCRDDDGRAGEEVDVMEMPVIAWRIPQTQEDAPLPVVPDETEVFPFPQGHCYALLWPNGKIYGTSGGTSYENMEAFKAAALVYLTYWESRISESDGA